MQPFQQTYVQCRHLLSENALDFLGDESAYERFVVLCNAEPGWDGQDAQALTAASVVSLNLFCQYVKRLSGITGLYLSVDGCLEVAYEKEDISVNITFVDARTVDIWISDESDAGVKTRIGLVELKQALGKRNLAEFHDER